MRRILASMVGLALSASFPAFAQTSAENPIDPAALAAAAPVIDKLWPVGTYRRMMDGSMSKMMDQIMASMFEMRAADMAGMTGDSKAAEKAGDASMGDLATKADPYFKERMRLTMNAITTEMIPLFDKVEPQVRESLKAIYARRFSAQQLDEMNAFFSTPTGKAYAGQAMLVYMDPEMIKAMQSFTPEIIKAMPGIMKKAEEATKHLPPPPKPDGKSD